MFPMGRTGELCLQSDIVGFYEGCYWKNIFTGDEYGYSKHWISLVSVHSGSGDRFYDKDGNEMPILNGIGMTGYRSDFHDAAIAAKQARFEHGEKGTPKKTLSRQQIEAPHRPSSESTDFINWYGKKTGSIDIILEWRKIVYESDEPWFAIQYRLLDLYARNGYTMHGVWEDQDTAEYQRDLYNKVMREEKGWTEYDPVTGMLIA